MFIFLFPSTVHDRDTPPRDLFGAIDTKIDEETHLHLKNKNTDSLETVSDGAETALPRGDALGSHPSSPFLSPQVGTDRGETREARTTDGDEGRRSGDATREDKNHSRAGSLSPLLFDQ